MEPVKAPSNSLLLELLKMPFISIGDWLCRMSYHYGPHTGEEGWVIPTEKQNKEPRPVGWYKIRRCVRCKEPFSKPGDESIRR